MPIEKSPDMTDDFDPQAELYGRLIKRGWIPPDGVEQVKRETAQSVIEYILGYRFGVPEIIPQHGKAPVIVCLDADNINDIKQEYGVK
jgi:hypothetical protein